MTPNQLSNPKHIIFVHPDREVFRKQLVDAMIAYLKHLYDLKVVDIHQDDDTSTVEALAIKTGIIIDYHVDNLMRMLDTKEVK